MIKTSKPPIKVMIFINDDMESITTLLLNNVSRLTEKVSLIVIIQVIKNTSNEILNINLELSFLKTPSTSKNMIESEMKISGSIKFKFPILLTS